MASNFIRESERLQITAGRIYTSGELFMLGGVALVAIDAAGAGDLMAAATSEVWEVPALPTEAWAEGMDLFFDSVNKAATIQPIGPYVGKAFKAKAEAGAVGWLWLNAPGRGNQVMAVTASGAKNKGDFEMIEDTACVWLTDTANTKLGMVAISGVYPVAHIAEIVAQGQQLYWDADGDPVGGTAGTGALDLDDDTAANKPAGKAVALAAAEDATVYLALNL